MKHRSPLVSGILVSVLVGLGAPSAARGAAGADRALSLRNAIAQAVQNNPGLAATVEDVAAADAMVVRSTGQQDWTVDLKADWVRYRRGEVADIPIQQPESDEIKTSLSVSRALPTGGRIGLSLNEEYSRTEYVSGVGSTAERLTIPVVSPSVLLNYTQPLLRGAGSSVALADERRARVRLDAATLNRRAQAATLLRNVVSAYADLQFATEEVEIRRAAFAAGEEQLEATRAQIEAGKLPPSAVADVEVANSVRNELLLGAQQQLRDCSVELARVMGMDIGSSSAGLVAANDDPPAAVPPIEEMLKRAVEHNPQLLSARQQIAADAIEADVTRDGLLPQLDLTFSGGPLGYAPEWGRAHEQVARFEGYTVQVGLVLQGSLQQRAAGGARDAAEATVRRTRADAREIEAQIRASLVRLAGAESTARARMKALSSALQAAEYDLKGEQARFEAGRSTNFDVLRRQDTVADVRVRFARALLDHRKATAAIEALTGHILERYGVDLR